MEATGSRRFFIVDDNIVSQPAKVRELCRELIPLKVGWVGQASIHIAHDDELLELMVQERLPRRADRHGVARPGQPARHGQGAGTWPPAATPRACAASASTAWRSTARSSSATTTTTPSVIQRSVDFAREQKLFLAAFNHLIPFPGTPLYRRLAETRAGC